MKTIIVAYDENMGIGAKNDLLWMGELPADLRHFRETTAGATVIMGRNTYFSIGRPLPNRQNIVVSYDKEAIEGVTVVSSLEEAYKIAKSEIFVIGGGQIYALAIDTVDRILATEVHAKFKAEIFFPAIDPSIWVEEAREVHKKDQDNKYDYDFVTYVRR